MENKEQAINDDEEQVKNKQGYSFKDNFMQKLTNFRFRLNDGEFFKQMAYPEVRVEIDGPINLMNRTQFLNQEEFNLAFR